MQEEGNQKLSFLSFSFWGGGGEIWKAKLQTFTGIQKLDACTDGYTSILCEAQVARRGGV